VAGAALSVRLSFPHSALVWRGTLPTKPVALASPLELSADEVENRDWQGRGKNDRDRMYEVHYGAHRIPFVWLY